MADSITPAPAPGGVDTTLAPAKVVSITELKNGMVFLATEAKVYQFIDGKLRPVIFADVEHEAAMARKPLTTAGAVAAGPAPVPPPLPVDPVTAKPAPDFSLLGS